MKIALASLSALSCCLVLACSDGGEDTGGLGGGATAGVGGSTAGTGTIAGSNSGGSSAGTAGASGSATGGSASGGAGGSGGTATAGSGGNGGSGGEAIPTDGPGLYAANCKMCHGEQGNGGKDGPDIKHPTRDYSTWVVRNGRAVTTYPKPMEKVGTDKLSDAQLALIFDYLDTPPQPTTGATLYADYCLNCHGADGKGGPTTRDITNELDKLKDQVRKGAHQGEFDMRKEYMSAFSTARISDAELDMIYDYVDSL